MRAFRELVGESNNRGDFAGSDGCPVEMTIDRHIREGVAATALSLPRVRFRDLYDKGLFVGELGAGPNEVIVLGDATVVFVTAVEIPDVVEENSEAEYVEFNRPEVVRRRLEEVGDVGQHIAYVFRPVIGEVGFSAGYLG